MIFIGIEAAKDKHDCFVVSSNGEVLFDVFTISNTLAGFNDLLSKIKSVSRDLSKTKVGLEATGHYSYNLLGFLLDNGLPTYVLNPRRVKVVVFRVPLQELWYNCLDAVDWLSTPTT